MKKRALKTLSLSKESISSLNQNSISAGAAMSPRKSLSAGTCCLSCTRSCNPDCKLTLENVDC